VHLINLIQDRDQWQAVVNVVMNLQATCNAGNFLTTWATDYAAKFHIFNQFLQNVSQWSSRSTASVHNWLCLALVMIISICKMYEYGAQGDTRWSGWLRHYATNWKVTGSSPDKVDFFNWPNPSSRTMALGSTQPLTEMSTRNLPGG
jgi:hypothetical protein